jgi:hypothetical protein
VKDTTLPIGMVTGWGQGRSDLDDTCSVKITVVIIVITTTTVAAALASLTVEFVKTEQL